MISEPQSADERPPERAETFARGLADLVRLLARQAAAEQSCKGNRPPTP